MKIKLVKSFAATCLTLSAILVSPGALAGIAASGLPISATLRANCIVSSTPVDFGVMTPATGSGNVLATGTVVVRCNKGKNFNMTSSIGTGASFADRSMGGTTGNTDRLHYNVYTDAARTNLFSSVSAGSKTGTGEDVVYTIYAKMPTNQFVKGDSYTDTLSVIITY